MRISDWSSDVCSSDLPKASPPGRSAAFSVSPAVPSLFISTTPRQSSTSAPCARRRFASRHPSPHCSASAYGTTLCSGTGCVRGSPLVQYAKTPLHRRSEEHTSELQSLMRISYAVFCLKNKQHKNKHRSTQTTE